MVQSHLKLYFTIVILVISCFIFLGNYKSFQVYPVEDISVYEVGTYHEEMDSNWTEAKFEIIKNQIVFSYHLSSAKDEPFAAFYFRDANIDSNIVDIKDFNTFSIYLKSNKAQKIPVSLRFRNDSIIKLSKSFPEISVTTVIDYKKEGTYQVKLSDFEIATWWLRFHGIEKESINLKELTQLKYLAIGSCQALVPGDSDQIIIDQVKFLNDYSSLYVISFLFLIVLFFILFFIGRLKRKKQTIVVEHLEVQDSKEEKQKKVALIKNFIGKQYVDPEFNMYKIQKEFKMSSTELRTLFKEEFSDSFKGYLKTVRITEVKRLLKLESDLTIAETAYKCGFNDIPYFNRQFKSETGQSPKDFQNSFSR